MSAVDKASFLANKNVVVCVIFVLQMHFLAMLTMGRVCLQGENPCQVFRVL